MSHCLKMRVSCLVQGFIFALQSSTTFITRDTAPANKSTMSPHELLGPWLSPYLSRLFQYSLFDLPPPNFPPLLHSARHQKQGKLSLLSLPPPFLHRVPAFHLSYHHSQKSHGELLHVEAKGKAGWE